MLSNNKKRLNKFKPNLELLLRAEPIIFLPAKMYKLCKSTKRRWDWGDWEKKESARSMFKSK